MANKRQKKALATQHNNIKHRLSISSSSYALRTIGMVDRGLFEKKGSFALVLDPLLKSQIPSVSGYARFLPPNFSPGNWDVICHSGKDIHDHIGNRRFRICIENHLNSYTKAQSRSAKSAIISGIVTSIRECSTAGGGFVRIDGFSRRWYEVGDKVARDKVGQSLRDCSNLNMRKKKKRFVQFAEVLPSNSTRQNNPGVDQEDGRRAIQDPSKDWKGELIEPGKIWLSKTVDPLFYGSTRVPVAKFQKQEGDATMTNTATTDPLDFLPYKNEGMVGGQCNMRLYDQQVSAEATLFKQDNRTFVEQSVFDWFEADMQEI